MQYMAACYHNVMKTTRTQTGAVHIGFVIFTALVAVGGVLYMGWVLQRPAPVPEPKPVAVAKAPELRTVTESKTGSKFSLQYPGNWKLHQEASGGSGVSASEMIVLASPSGDTEVVLWTSDTLSAGGACNPKEAKLVSVDIQTVLKFEGVRYVRYVSQNPATNRYFLHAGVQEDNERVRRVTTTSGNVCDFSGSELFARVPMNVRPTTAPFATLQINVKRLVGGGTQAAINEVVTSDEFAEAETIARSLAVSTEW